MTPIASLFAKAKGDWLGVGLFSCAINILMLTGPLFMLQVYDRVLTSRSVPTLTVLFLLVVFLYALLGVFTFYRNRVLSRVGYRLEDSLMGTAQKRLISQSYASTDEKFRPVSDLAFMRQFISSNGLTSFFDLPWVPIFMIVVFMMHPWLGMLTLGGVICITLMTLLNERMSHSQLAIASEWDGYSTEFSESARTNADAIASMGMMGHIVSYWQKIRQKSLYHSQKASGRSEIFSSISKTTRLLLQSALLGLGGYLAIYEVITPGTMIAASIIGGRALAPIDQVIGNWRNFVMSRQAYKRLKRALPTQADKRQMIDLPKPTGHLKISHAYKFVRSSRDSKNIPILRGIDFELLPGDGLGVIGPSASGKTSLVKLLTGVWTPERGSVRLDEATYDQWDLETLGQYVGYLPQSTALLPGTIKSNISRFDPNAADADIIEAAKTANVHELIMNLPGGYEAVIGQDVFLSGGQVQRIALARAIYKRPVLIILDEPNSNLDAEGDAALSAAIARLRKQGSTVIVMAHRPSAIAAVNKVLVLKNGMQTDFGEKQEVLARAVAKRKTQALKNSAGIPQIRTGTLG